MIIKKSDERDEKRESDGLKWNGKQLDIDLDIE
jgi:hypothetical protein